MTDYSRTSIRSIATINPAIVRTILIFFVVIVLSHKLICAKDWVLSNPPLTGSQLYDVAFITPQEGFAVGANGVIVHSIDSGRTWELQKTPVDYPGFLLSVDFVNDTGYVVGGVFGRTFALMTANRGKDWIDVSSRFPVGGLRNIQIHNNAVWVTHWNRTPNVSVSRDRCTTWESDTIGEGSLLGDILFVNDTVGFICGDKGFIGKTINGGRNWLKVSDTLRGVYEEISYTEDWMYALGLKGQLAISRDTGNSWNYFINVQDGDFTAMVFRQTDNEFIDNGFIVVSDNTVIRLRDVAPPTTPIVTSILPNSSPISTIAISGPDRTIAVCLNGAIYEIFGLADSCRELTSNTGGDITVMDFHDSLNGICGTNAGELLFTSDDGQSWTKNVLPTKGYIVSIIAFSNGRTLAINKKGEKYVSLDFGQTWDIDNDVENPMNIGYSSTPSRQIFKNSVYSNCAYVVKNDSIFITNNAGKTWRRQGLFTIENPDNNEKRNCIAGLSFTDNATGWGVTVGGAVSTTIDTGRTWIPISNIPDITVNNIFFIDSLHGWVCGKRSAVSPAQPQIYYTNNGGKTWDPIQAMHFDPVLDRHTDLAFEAEILEIGGTNIQSLWALSSEGPLFSSDSGKTWQQQMLPQYGNRFSDLFVGANGEIFVAGDNSRIWNGAGYIASVKMPNNKYFGCKNTLFQAQRINVFDLKGRKIATCHKGAAPVKNAARGVYIAKEKSAIHRVQPQFQATHL